MRIIYMVFQTYKYWKKVCTATNPAERAIGVDKSFISRLMNGHKVAPSAETLEARGLRAVPLYEVLKPPNVRAKPARTAGRLERGASRLPR